MRKLVILLALLFGLTAISEVDACGPLRRRAQARRAGVEVRMPVRNTARAGVAFVAGVPVGVARVGGGVVRAVLPPYFCRR